MNQITVQFKDIKTDFFFNGPAAKELEKIKMRYGKLLGRCSVEIKAEGPKLPRYQFKDKLEGIIYNSRQEAEKATGWRYWEISLDCAGKRTRFERIEN